MTFKPTLAATIDPMDDPEVFHKLRFPLWVSPKYDGIRGIGRNGALLSRTLKPLPSAQVQARFGHLTHFDGEIIAGDPCDGDDVYNRTQSHVMSRDKPHADLRYYVFDWADEACAHVPFEQRVVLLKTEVDRLGRDDVIFVEPRLVQTLDEFLAAEQAYIELGFEGIMGRRPASPYKHGRSTFNEHNLLKCKRFADFEAAIVGFVEQLTNTNAAETDELGHTKRSSAKDGLLPAGTLGKFIVEYGTEDGEDCAEIPCGVLTHDLRQHIWDNQASFLGQYIKVRHFPFGAKTGLRLPRCVGFRDPIDM